MNAWVYETFTTKEKEKRMKEKKLEKEASQLEKDEEILKEHAQENDILEFVQGLPRDSYETPILKTRRLGDAERSLQDPEVLGRPSGSEEFVEEFVEECIEEGLDSGIGMYTPAGEWQAWQASQHGQWSEEMLRDPLRARIRIEFFKKCIEEGQGPSPCACPICDGKARFGGMCPM